MEEDLSGHGKIYKNGSADFEEASAVLGNLRREREWLIGKAKEGSFAERAALLDAFKEVIDFYEAILY
jgi:hypothetical protein